MFWTKKKSRGMACLYLVACIVFGIISGVSTNASTPTVVSDNSSSGQSTANSNGPQIYKVGQTVKIDNCEMTVTKVEKSNGSDYDKPQKSGNEFVIVSIKIKNDGTDTLSYNPFYFKMQNSQGQITDTTITTVDQSTHLNSGDLAAGGGVSGTIVFEEPKNDGSLVLQYQDNVFANGTKLQFKCS